MKPSGPNQSLGTGGSGAVANAGPVVIVTDPSRRRMTQEETANLKALIDDLTIEQKKGIVPIV